MLVPSDSAKYRVFSAPTVEAVDTVGAGDAFFGSLGAYLARGLTLEQAIEKAVRWGEIYAPDEKYLQRQSFLE